MSYLSSIDPEMASLIDQEAIRQEEGLELIASENYTSKAVMEANGSVLTNKYAEGYPGRRYYEGCGLYDTMEDMARNRLKEIFGAKFVNVQPHSGAQANMAVEMAFLNAGDTILSLDLDHGGHLSHGHKLNYSGRNFNIVGYKVNPDTEQLDYDAIAQLARECKPQLIIAGASAYPRTIDFEKFGNIAKEVGALLMADIAHIAGLVAAGLHNSPIGIADFVTSTTHKTLRGPRGGVIMCNTLEHHKKINSLVFPGIQGGPLMHTIAAKAVAFKEVLDPSYKQYQKQVLLNCQALLGALKDKGYRIVSGGSDNHLFLLDLASKGLQGKEASHALEEAGITTNMNLIPYDKNPAMNPSGLRMGTPALTTRGMKEPQMVKTAELIDKVLNNIDNEDIIKEVKTEVIKLAKEFPLYNK